MKKISKFFISVLMGLTLIQPSQVFAADSNSETFYGYQSATYSINNVKTDNLATSYTPWYKNVYKYNYDYKETHSSTDFTIANTKARSGTVWSRYLDGYHLTKFVSDIDMCKSSGWTNYYQPKVDVKDDRGTLFTGQNRSSNIQQNGTWTGDIVIKGTLSMYAYAETGSGRDWTGSGGYNYIEYYKISSKVSDWVFNSSDIVGATTINSLNSTGYVLPTWSPEQGWRTITPYNKNQNTKPVSMNVTYDPNGGAGSMNLNATQVATLSRNNYSKPGYTFDGWNTKPDGTGKNIADGANISTLSPTDGADVTLYAKWKPNKYSVTFDSNGGSGTMSAISVDYDSEVNLPAATFTKSGYLFAGWNTKPDGTGVSYADKATIKNLTSTNGATIKLYAQWRPAKYTVSFNGNGGTGSMSSIVLKYDEESRLPANQFNKTGYVFAGWNTKQDGSGNNYPDKALVKNIAPYTNDAITLFAQWKDVTPPVITITGYNPSIYKPDGSLNFTNSNVQVSIKVEDAGSGLAKVEIVHGSNVVSTLGSYEGDKVVNLTHVVSGRIQESDNYYIKATDKAGNVAYKPLVIPNIDKQKPTIDDSDGYLRCGMSLNGPQSVILKVGDDYSGIREWSYKVNYKDMFGEELEGSWITGDSSLKAEINVPDSTVARVFVKVNDNAGNYNEINSCPVTFNKTYEAVTTLSDYGYVFGLYDSKYGKGTVVSDSIAREFLEYLSNDTNETSKSALRYMQTLTQNGKSKKQALEDFMSTFRYDRH